MRYFAVVTVLLGTLFGSWRAAQAQATPPPAATPPAGQAAASAKYAGKLSTDPAQYIADVQAMMLSTNNAAARQAGAKLQALWGSNTLTSSQQARIVALSQTMLAKKFKPKPHFQALFEAIVGGATPAPGASARLLSDAQLDQYLDVLGQTLDKEAPVETDKFLTSSSRLLNGGYLYRSTYNTLRVVGGTIAFAYSPNLAPDSGLSFDDPKPAPEPAPAADPKPAATPAKQTATTPAKKPAAKAAPKKKKSSGWDTSDLWSSPSGGGWGNDDGWGSSGGSKGKDDGWGSNDGWGTPAKKKTPAKKPVAKTTPKATPKANPADFSSGFDDPMPAPVADSGPLPYYDTYQAPPTRGAVVVVKDADLFMATAGDSVFLRKVSGTAVPGTNRFVATAGQLTWSIKTNLVTAAMTKFDFDMGKPEFTAEPVTLTYDAVLQAPIKGAISYKAVRRKPGAPDTGYPRFISLTNDARLKSLGADVQYRGGFSLAGGRMLSAALDATPGYLTVSVDGKRKFRAVSPAYVLGDSLITAGRAAVTLYEAQKDSLTNPGVELKYLRGKQQLRLSRAEGMYGAAPYVDTYHQLAINTELVVWNVREPKIEFNIITARDQQAASFESRNFFSDNRYQQIKSINRIHPLQMLVGYSQAHGNVQKVNIRDLAEELQTKPENLRPAMSGLARDGYAQWDGRTGDITLTPKGKLYVAAARNKSDYDHIAIKSLVGSGRSATLNLNNNQLLVRGVAGFNFSSDSSAVFVKPDSSLIRIGQNRTIDFGGTIVAPTMRFKGKEFKFDYQGFYVDMAKIDSIVIRGQVKKGSKQQTGKDFTLANKGKTSSGRLYINDPLNKSARKKKPNFPSFDSKNGTSVYFGKQDVLGGSYDSTMVFDIPPFKLDSLNGLGKTASGFDGTFRSGGIFPDIKTKLTTQPDGSLGFVYDVPKEGFALYKGRGKVFSQIKMDSKGLQSSGTVQYQSGTFTSDNFVYYRDSVVAVGKTGVIAAKTGPGVDIPKMNLPNGYLMKWDVKADSMYLTAPGSSPPVKMYNDAYAFKGTAILTPRSVGGAGTLDGPQSLIKSPAMTFGSNGYSGRKADFSVKSAQAGKPALTAGDVAFTYDLKKGVAEFTREEGSKGTIDLPYSQFKSSLTGGRWDFKKKQVQLRVAPGTDSTKAYFTSTNAEQGGLKFKATGGLYDLAKSSLEVSGVPYIAVVDSWVIPDSGRVSVLAKGQLKNFRNAGLVMDSLAKSHKLYGGNIQVKSRMLFTGDALYGFKTARDSFAIKFSSFQADSSAFVDKNGRPRKPDPDNPFPISTSAVGTVESKESFQIAPRIGYRGNVQLNSQRSGLAFDGQVQLQFGKLRNTSEWFAVKDSIDPKNFSLTLREPKAEDGTALLTGLFMSDVSTKVYPLYVGPLPNSTDIPLFQVDGKLRYDERKGEFTISRVTEPSDPNSYEGAVLTYQDQSGELGFRGPMTFIGSTSKDVRMSGSAVGKANPDSARYSAEALLALDITLPGKAVDVMSAELKEITKNSPEALNGSTNELYNLGQFLGNKGVETYVARQGSPITLPTLAPKLAGHTILLSKVDLRWSEKKKAWYSVGKLGLAGVGKQGLNALIDGYVEIRRDNSADVLEIYLEAEPQVWYYFKYANNVLLAKSQNEGFDAVIGGQAKGDPGTATSYGVFLGEYQDVDNFRSHFQRDYLGGTGKLAARQAAPPASSGNFDFADDKKGKKKKGKADDAFGSDDPGTDGGADPAAAPAATKKKKKNADADPFGSGEGADQPAATPAPTKKKKDSNDPFGGGEEPAPAPTPAKTTPAATTPATTPAATTPAKTEPAATPAPTKTADAPATTPDGDFPADEGGKKKKKDKAADTPPAAPPAASTPAAPDPAQLKKEEERQRKEAEKAAKDAEKAAKEEAKRKAEEEKKKKAAENDPFGG